MIRSVLKVMLIALDVGSDSLLIVLLGCVRQLYPEPKTLNTNP